MKRNNCYELKKIADIPYLLPIGQMIADHKHSIRLNETGVYLWDLLKEERTLDDLIFSCSRYYTLDDSKAMQLKKDITHFTDSLMAVGALLPSTPPEISDIKSPFYKCFEIAGIKCGFWGPADAFSDAFAPFLCERPSRCDLCIEILTTPPRMRGNGRLLLRDPELFIIEATDHYILLFPTASQILEAYLAKDGNYARFYCIPPFNDGLREDLFHAFRLIYLYLAEKHQMAALHSASILYKGRAWLFSAPSGTGKSTHTNLWKTLLRTPVINGDLNLLTIKDGRAVIHGIPWCGTSGIYDTHTYPLGGIILLKRSEKDLVELLTEDQKQLLVLQRLISPAWDKHFLSRNLELTNALVKNILVCRLLCTPKMSSVETIKAQIDAYLKHS